MSQTAEIIQLHERPPKVKADIDDGWHKIATTLARKECRVNMNQSEWKVYSTVKLRTFGFRKSMDWIAAPQFEEETGIKAKKIFEIKQRLIDRNILIADGRKVGVNTVVSDWLDKPITPKQGCKTLPPNRVAITPIQDRFTPKQGIIYPQTGGHNKKDINNKIITKDTCTTRISKPQSFKDFFTAYPIHRKGGSDASAWKAWKSEKLTEDDAQLAIDWLTHSASLNPDWQSEANGQYVFGITKFIRERIWLTPIQQPKRSHHEVGWHPIPKQTQRAVISAAIMDIEDTSW